MEMMTGRRRTIRVKHEEKERELQVLRQVPPPLPKGACPKCGKKVGKGLWMHMKYCGVVRED